MSPDSRLGSHTTPEGAGQEKAEATPRKGSRRAAWRGDMELVEICSDCHVARPVSALYCAVIRCAEVSFCSEDVFVHMSFPQKTCTFKIIKTVSDYKYFRPLCDLNESLI